MYSKRWRHEYCTRRNTAVYNRKRDIKERRNAATSHLRDIKCPYNITLRELIDKLDNANCKQNILEKVPVFYERDSKRDLPASSSATKCGDPNAETFNCNDNAHRFTASRTALHFSRNRNALRLRYPLFRTEQDRVRSQILSRYERFPREPELYLRLRTFRHPESCRPRHVVDIVSKFLERYVFPSYGIQKNVSLM